MQAASIKNKFLLIVAMTACYAMIFIDESGIAVTLPMMQQTISLTDNAVHWVINSYLLVLSVLLLLGGKLADIYGQRKIFAFGITIFLLASIICANSENAQMMIIGRLLQGLGASLLMPCITVLIQRGVSENEFGKIFGLILGLSNFFYAIGPFVGGAVTEFVSWHWFFWINIPIGIICLVFTFLTIKKDNRQIQSHFSDIKGLITFLLTLTALIFAIMQGAMWGWDNPWILSLFATSIIAGYFFIKIELNTKDPLLDIRLFSIKLFMAGNIILFCSSICLTILVFLALWLQKSIGFSPATVGLALLPATLTFIFIPSMGGAWVDRSGARVPTLLGTVLIIFGIFWMAATLNLESYWWILIGLLAFGVGIPLAIPSSIMTIMQSVDPSQSGMASGTFTTVRQLALSMGIAILSAIVTSFNDSHLAAFLKSSPSYFGIKAHQVNLLMAGKNIIPQLGSEQIIQLKNVAASIYTHSMIFGFIVIGIFALIAWIVALKSLGNLD